MISLVCSFEIASDGHSVVGFKDLAGSEPCIGRVFLAELFLVVIVSNEVFEIDG